MKTDFKKLLSEKEYIENVETINPFQFEFLFNMRNGYTIPLEITFSPLFPSQLPFVFINKRQHIIPKIPHVMNNGLICFLEREGVIWNNIPESTLDFVFERVEKVLIADSPKIEYHREFSYYFGSLQGIHYVFSVFTPSDYPMEISVLTLKNRPLAFLTENNESKQVLSRVLNININSRKFDKAFFIPLDLTYNGSVPERDRFWSNTDIIKLVKEHTTSDTISKIKDFAINKNNYYYLLSIPLLTGEKTIIGLWYKKINPSISKKVVPIIDESVADCFEIIPLFIFREDDSSLVERGGGVKKNINTLLIGCGSVGSDLLFLLARSGIKNFTILDNDSLNIENSYRHFLGMNKSILFKPKVELLKEEFESRYPNVEIKTLDKDALSVIDKREINLNDYDLIIVAIGDPNVERKLNEFIVKSSTPAIFTWVEAYGIGGHALMVNNRGKGCYECLIDDELNMLSAFAGKSDVPFIKSINGCATSFTPYGSIDSMETALLASRLVLRYLNNEINGNPLISWRGSSKAFEKSGYQTSERYRQPLDILMQDTYEYINSSCKICSIHPQEALSNA
ncbi:ThiF family adenylyltransferase [Neobacillus sp. OS1-32]|uniref:ThiF family adenylyltransferase n=1 Tax=Neobacillus sp. OS1-32 TaxID=3070682 RepID=UPI0027E12DBC|nr:ThiF family adenylyltransferase [Neobacillus sp. OS1-32]WML32238.1 ThiF family adenylyltransferase [Neobacillus sp. OS1-32]